VLVSRVNHFAIVIFHFVVWVPFEIVLFYKEVLGCYIFEAEGSLKCLSVVFDIKVFSGLDFEAKLLLFKVDSIRWASRDTEQVNAHVQAQAGFDQSAENIRIH